MKPFLPAARCALPPLGLLALAPTFTLYPLCRGGLVALSPSLLGLILILSGAIQFSAGLGARKQGNVCGSAALIPLGLFSMSLLGLHVFPALGLGQRPSSVAMTSYLTIWGLFAAILYLGSFRQNRIVQLLFGSMMICLLSLGMAEVRDNPVFFFSAAVSGLCTALAALYAGVALALNSRMQRTIIPLGPWRSGHDSDYDERVAP